MNGQVLNKYLGDLGKLEGHVIDYNEEETVTGMYEQFYN